MIHRLLFKAVSESEMSSTSQLLQDYSLPLNVQWFGSVLDQSFNEIYILDADTLRILHANVGACRNMQYSLDELRQMTAYDVSPLYTREFLDTLFAPLLSGERIDITFEGLRRRKDGTTYPIEARVQRFSDGERTVLVGIAVDITERKQNEEKLRELSAHLQFAREEERARIAREIHDELGGVLTAIRYQLAPSRKRRKDQDAPSIADKQSITTDLVDRAIQSLRRIITDLRPSILDDLGLWAALEWQARDFSERTTIPCIYEMAGEECPVSPDRATAIFRINQEILTNIARHAQATAVSIDVNTTEHEVNIRIRDNGIGITRDQLMNLKSHGILGIHERARHFKGTVRFSGREGKGTTVIIRFPLDKPIH
jgi:PAS domain S-box-containing protein